MIKVLYISYDGMTDPLGQSQVLPYLDGLTKKGCSIHLISFEKADKFALHKEHIATICANSGISWHPLSYTKKPALLSTIYDVQRMKRLAHQLHKQHDFQIIHCRSYISALVGLKMKKKYGTKFVFDMRGFWADERVEGNIWNLEIPIYKTVYNYFKKKELAYFKEADYTISLTQTGKNEIESWKDFNQNPPAIEVIPCCVDLELFDPTKIQPEQITSRKAELSIAESDYVLGYVGSIGTWYMLSEMLDYFKVLKATNKHAKFLFVTGENPITIKSAAVEKGIEPNDIIITSCRHKEVPLHIRLFDASLFFIRPTFSKKASSPTKQGEIMAMGIPLICNAGVGDTDSVVKHYQSGIVLEQLYAAAYESSMQAKSDFDAEKTMAGAKEFYGLEVGVERYFKVYNAVLKS